MAKTRRRNPLSKKDPNVVSSTIENSEADILALLKEERSRRVQEVCAAIDREVKARTAAIRAITHAQKSAIVQQLKTLQRQFSDEMLDMPLTEFLSKYCPNTEAVEKDGIVELRKKAVGESKLHTEGELLDKVLPTGANIASSESVKEELLKRVEAHVASVAQRQGDDLYFCREIPLDSSSLRTPHMCWTTTGKYLVTPKTMRFPKHGETLLSQNGSPLGVYGRDGILPVSEDGPPQAAKITTARPKRVLRSALKVNTLRA